MMKYLAKNLENGEQMNKKHTMTFISFLLISSISLISCTQSQEDSTIKIGAILHLTNNDYSSVGVAMQEGIDLAVAEQNKLGGINGKQIVVIYEDDQYNIQKANTAA